jgi:hypothetical protein
MLFSGQSAAFADDTDNNVTATDVAQAVASTGVDSQSNDVKTTSDANSAAVSTTDGTTVDVARDPSEGVGITASDGVTLNVTTPNADNSGNGKVIADGVVAYPAKDGSATAVQATENGGVRMMTVIDNADASTRYPYNVSVPDGGSIQLMDDGGAEVLDSGGQAIANVAPAWAKDANGNDVPTHFEVSADGTTLTQVIDHNADGVAYPVTADPFWSTAWKVAKCSFWLGVFAVESVTLVKAIKALGGFGAVATALITKGLNSHTAEVILKVAEWVSGIKEIKNNCLG